MKTIVEEARQSLGKLQGHKQAAWAALKWSVWSRFEYWAGLCYPSDSIPAAKELDRQLWNLLEGVCGTLIPQTTSLATRSWDCRLQLEMLGREDWTFSTWVVRQPVKLGGMGLRSYTEQCRLAFYSTQEQALPQLYKGFCPLLEPVVGGGESFDVDSSGENRWGTLLQPGTRLGKEFGDCWAFMQKEAQEGAAWLGEEEVKGPLGKDAVSAGEGSCAAGKDSTRARIQEQRERMMGRLLTEGLLHHPDQESRPVWSWPERDKLSSQWLLALPGHDTSLTSEEFTQCVEALLCLPSTACAAKIGEKVGNSRVDVHGDSVVSEKVKGDGWRKRHDGVKRCIVSLHKWSGVEVECEVFNLISGLIPQRGLSRLEDGRKRQGLVPDFRVREPVVEGGNQEQSVLAELKVISSCPTRYARNP